MEQPSNRAWFLRKHDDGSVFGPLSFEQLAVWASTAQIAPHDLLSIDQQSWIKAPMLPQLGMDWLVEVTSEHFYGPTTLGAIQEFFRLGEINEETFLINTCDGARRQLQELPELLHIPNVETIEDFAAQQNPGEPAASGISIRLQEQIRDLEQTLSEERRVYAELEQKYNELTQRVGD
jgi:hypothetical protein